MWLTALRDRIRASWWGLILADMDTEPVELLGGATKVLIGLWLLLPFRTFALSPAYESLSVIPEWAWGGFLVSLGVFHLGVLRLGDRRWRRVAALAGFLVWFVVGATFLLANPAGIGSLAFLMLSAASCWASLRLTGGT